MCLFVLPHSLVVGTISATLRAHYLFICNQSILVYRLKLRIVTEEVVVCFSYLFEHIASLHTPSIFRKCPV